MSLVLLARAWILVAHVVAFLFAAGLFALHLYLLEVKYVGDTLVQVDPTIPTLYTPALVMAVISGSGHVVLLVHTLMGMTKTIRQSRRAIVPARSSIIVFNPDRKATGPHMSITSKVRRRLEKSKLVFWWGHHSAEITRLLILWEVALQTFQANKISQLITSQWINRLVTAAIVVNCWFSPTLHYFLGARPSTHVRLARLLVDSFLGIAYNIGIPLVIFFPYYCDFDGSLSIFPQDLYFMDTWYINAISELRQVFITSWIDWCSKVTGAIGLQYRLYTILCTAIEAQRETAIRAVQPNPPAPMKRSNSRITRSLDIVLMMWGATVLALHIHAAVTSFHNHNNDCLLETRPWGSTQYTCAALEISCPDWQTIGDQDKLHNAIASVNPASVEILIVSNCPALHVPANVRKLSNILTIKMYNSTITKWSEDAALTATHHPLLKTLYFARVHMSAIPPGLLSVDFPKTIWTIMFCLSDVTNFPDQISSLWTNVFLLAVVGNPSFTTIPRGIVNLPSLGILGLRQNNISTIPDDALSDTTFLFIDLAGNPLTTLPDSVGSIEKIDELDIRGTLVRDLPSVWSYIRPSLPRLPTIITAGGSPLCGRDAPIDADLIPWITLDCTASPLGFIGYAYPINDEDLWRHVNQ